MTALSEDEVGDLARKIAELEERLRSAVAERDAAVERQTAATLEQFRLETELRAALDRQKASIEILRSIAATSGNADYALQQIAETTQHFFNASSVTIRIANGKEWIRTIRVGGGSERIMADIPASELAIEGKNVAGLVYRENRQIHVPDLEHIDASIADYPGFAPARAGGSRTVSGTPLRRDAGAIGAIIIHRDRLAPFTDEELALQQSFADQAVIAIENARLFNATRAALDHQKASAEILRTIASAPGDSKRSLQQIAETCGQLFGAPSVSIQLIENGQWADAVRFGTSAQHIRSMVPLSSIRIGGPNMPGQVIARNAQIHIPDLDHLDPAMADWPGLPPARATGTRTMCGTPLRREGASFGALIIYRDRLAPFTDEELALQQSFADQGVIAIENARLFNETQEALEQQTATSEILRVINNSTGNLAPVFESILEKAHHLCGAPCGSLQLYEQGRVVPVAIRGMTDAFTAYLRAGYPITDGVRGILFADRPIQLVDVAEFHRSRPDEPSMRAAVELGGIGTMLTVPLAKDGKVFGRIVAGRREIGAFTDKQISMLQGFADQAVIAIENARLFNETQEALERQTATADILKVIAASPSDAQPVFDAIAASANRLVDGFSTAVHRAVDDMVELAAFTPTNPESDEALKAAFPMHRSEVPALALVENGQTAQIADAEAGDTITRQLGRARGWRSVTFTPLMNRGTCIGFIACSRRETGVLADHHVQLLRTFADQAVIAIENARLFNETKEALERQTATADILKVIASSPADVQPVFEAILSRALRLCEAAFGFLTIHDGERFDLATHQGVPAALARYLQAGMDQPRSGDAHWRLLAGEDLIHNLDQKDEDAYRAGNPLRRAVVDLGGARTALVVALRKGGSLRGAITIYRKEVRPFSESQITLLRHFADQAVIAIENVRLFRETQEALERQTATADILKVIASSPSNVAPVFDAIVGSAAKLFEPCAATIVTLNDDKLDWRATAALQPDYDVERARTVYPLPFDPDRYPSARAIVDRRIVEIPDSEAPDAPDKPRQTGRIAGFRSATFVPLVNDSQGIGVIILTHPQPGFRLSKKQLDLVQTFADQAIIAIQNTRLFNETQEALERQTATADILKVIASSPSDVAPVFEAIVASANRLLGGFSATVYRFIDGQAHLQAFTPTTPEADEILKSNFPLPVDRFAPFEIAQAGEVAQIPDTETLTGEILAISRARGFRSMLFAPLVNKGRSIGIVAVTRVATGTFADHHVQLLKTFADQAAIAIENTRLFDEVQAKTADLEESLQQQTATADVLKVISRSAFDLQPVFDTIVQTASRLCDAEFALIYELHGDRYEIVSANNAAEAFVKHAADNPLPPGRGSLVGRTALARKSVHIPDCLADSEYSAMDYQTVGQYRTMLGVPLLREGLPIGVIGMMRTDVRPFTEKQIELVMTFADQAVIAIANVRLFDEVQARTQELAKSLDDLRTAQGRLIQTEKLASLGQLTAGIAHEIKNPLNFVNNFSALSIELTDELNDLLKQVTLADKLRGEVDELTTLLKDNLDKVVQHGRRADSIVKNMLLHSREGSGEHRPADVNALVDESLNLAYHGARAEKPQFNVTLQRDFDPEAGMIEVFPQEITRVLLNMITNGFYAVTKRKADNGGAGYEPMVTASTRGLSDRVEIRIRDNGTGIPPEVKEKMFNPFFTTKPAGEGTGLGLSMSHDIIVKQHGGTIDVDTEPGVFTEFTIVLPRHKN